MHRGCGHFPAPGTKLAKTSKLSAIIGDTSLWRQSMALLRFYRVSGYRIGLRHVSLTRLLEQPDGLETSLGMF